MPYNKDVKIIAFVGLSGSGKSTAIEYLSKKSYPKVSSEDMLSQIEHLVEAGQHRITTDELDTLKAYQALRASLHSELIIIAVVVSKHIRYHRLEIQVEHPENHIEAIDEDFQEVTDNKSELIGIADYYVTNNSGVDSLTDQIDALLTDIKFYE